MTDSTAIATTKPRLPMPANAGVDAGKWRVLVEAIFPAARSPEAVMLALDYCKARGLDVMKKPVNIVPMWNAQLRREVETVWPSINEIQITAARTKEWAGMDPPQWGPEVQRKFEGRRKNREGQWIDTSVTATFPEWCSVTVYRMIGSTRCAFTEPVYWAEAYGRVGGSELPNDMWCKRPHGQLHKVAKAASLRAAFPEEGGEHVAEEMEGNTIDPIELDRPPPPKPADNWSPPDKQAAPPAAAPPPATSEPPPVEHVDADTGEILLQKPQPLTPQPEEEWREWGLRYLTHITPLKEITAIDDWKNHNLDIFEQLKKEAPKVHARLEAAISRHKLALAEQESPPQVE